MAPITATKGKYLQTLKSWASRPSWTNFQRIPGLAALKNNNALFVQKLIAKFCPDAMSMSLRRANDNMRQYILIHEGGWASDACGAWKMLGETKNKDDCARSARDENM